MDRKLKEESIKISTRVPKAQLEILMKEYNTDKVTEVIKCLMEEKIESGFAYADSKRSVITAIGAKSKLANVLIQKMPDHSHYIEPFGRTASVLLQKSKVPYELYNDIDKQVTNFFRVLRDTPSALYNACQALPYSEDLYYHFLNKPISGDPITQAQRFFYINRAGYMGNQITGFRADTPQRSYSRFYYAETKRFFAISKRLQGVEILNKDVKKIINLHRDNPHAFFFLDPPYLDGTSYYDHRFEWKHHQALAQVLQQVKGKVMICLSYHKDTHRLYTGLGYRVETVNSHYFSGRIINESGGLARPPITIYLYKNY